MRRAVFVFMAFLVPPLGFLLATLGWWTLAENWMGLVLIVVGLSYAIGVIVVIWIKRAKRWNRRNGGEIAREQAPSGPARIVTKKGSCRSPEWSALRKGRESSRLFASGQAPKIVGETGRFPRPKRAGAKPSCHVVQVRERSRDSLCYKNQWVQANVAGFTQRGDGLRAPKSARCELPRGSASLQRSDFVGLSVRIGTTPA